MKARTVEPGDFIIRPGEGEWEVIQVWHDTTKGRVRFAIQKPGSEDEYHLSMGMDMEVLGRRPYTGADRAEEILVAAERAVRDHYECQDGEVKVSIRRNQVQAEIVLGMTWGLGDFEEEYLK